MSIKKSIALMILILFIGFAAVVAFVKMQYDQTTKEVESRIYSQLNRKAVIESEAVHDLIFGWKKSIQTVRQDAALPRAIEALLGGFRDYKPIDKDLEINRKDLENFLKENLLPTLEKRQAHIDLQTLIPKDAKTLALQNQYIVNNPNPIDDKQSFLAPPNDSSTYAKAHSTFHSYLLALMDQADALDLLLIELETGYVFYTAQKEIDFASNLNEGFLSSSNLGALYKKMKYDPRDETSKMVDFAFYIPSMAEPELFIGMPISIEGKPTTLLVMKFDLNKINALMEAKQPLDNQDVSESLEEDHFLVGSDLMMHSNSRLYMLNPEKYIKNLIQSNISTQLIERIQAYNSTALLLEVNYPAVLQGLTGSQGVKTFLSPSGQELLVGFAPIELSDFNLVVLLTADKNIALKPIRAVTFQIIYTVLALFVLILGFCFFLLRINLRLEHLVEERTKDVNDKNMVLNKTLVSLTETQDQLIQTERLVSNVINSMPSPMIILDDKERIILWNNEAEKEAKVSYDDAKYRKLVSLFPIFKNEMAKIVAANQTKLPKKIDRIVSKQGNITRYFEVLIYPLLGEHITGSTILMQDITEQIKMTNNIQQSEKLASIGVLTAGVAHEINNPLNFITSNTHVLKRDINEIISLLKEYFLLSSTPDVTNKIQELEKQRETLDIDYTIGEIDALLKGIEEGGKRTATIVKDLRTFSRLDEAGMKKSNIQEGLDSTITLLEHRLKDKIELVKEYHPIPQIDCYPGKLNQVFMNLISNAIQSIKNKGTIWIKTEQKNDTIVISIKDNGSGISEENKSKIFEPFFTTKDVGEGTGLGLYISFSIIQEHGGTIHVSSELGLGTEFVITLPITGAH